MFRVVKTRDLCVYMYMLKHLFIYLSQIKLQLSISFKIY